MFAAVHRLELFIKRVDTNDNMQICLRARSAQAVVDFSLLLVFDTGVSHSECQWNDRGRAGRRRDVRHHHDALGCSRRALEPAQVSYSFVCVARLYLTPNLAGPLIAEPRANGTS